MENAFSFYLDILLSFRIRLSSPKKAANLNSLALELDFQFGGLLKIGDDKSSVRLVASRLKSGYESITVQNRKHIITITPLGNWRVNLPSIMKVKQFHDKSSVPKQVV